MNPHIPNLQNLSLTTRYSLMSYPEHLLFRVGVLALCKECNQYILRFTYRVAVTVEFHTNNLLSSNGKSIILSVSHSFRQGLGGGGGSMICCLQRIAVDLEISTRLMTLYSNFTQSHDPANSSE